MKNNCPVLNAGVFLRYINKDTMEYVDFPYSSGNNVSIYLDILKNIDYYSGRLNILSPGEPRKYHYCVILRDDNPNIYLGFMKYRNQLYSLDVDKQTFKIIKKTKVLYKYENNNIHS